MKRWDLPVIESMLQSSPYVVTLVIDIISGHIESDTELEKKKKGQIDRISTLPDSILLRILSFLPTKDAVETGVLSKRWAYLWTSVPYLLFDFNHFECTDDFASAVDHTLLLHRASKLTNFSVRFKYKKDLKPRVDLWVRFATAAKVDQLSLDFSPPCYIDLDGYQLPQHLYANEFISELNLSYCKIFPNGLLHWSSLKHLCIGQSPLHEDVIRKVLMGSPRLESLELHDCWEFNRLDIVSESLKKLVIDGYLMGMSKRYAPVLELEIVAPKIHSLEILGNFYYTTCRIKDVSALVEVKLDFDMRRRYHSEEDNYIKEVYGYKEYRGIVRDILQSVHHVKKLTVGNWCLMVVSLIIAKHPPSLQKKCICTTETNMENWNLLTKCQCLTMETNMENWNLPGIAFLLQSSPYLETLNFHIPPFCRIGTEYLRWSYHAGNHWELKDTYFKFLLLCLKSVKIQSYGGLMGKKELNFVVQFLLKNAKVLEKMVITPPRAWQNPTHDMLRGSLQMAQKLLSFPRSSPHAVVIFSYL
ncbi:F-box protein At5g03100-like [Quercus robur]|uniref:F-box protein At5g03100-like n=1 Tax=Quercus robur TaxID=38942 RepID=UPI002163536C|nr:F-box protein At5g03100-like [Quercus robur]